MDNEIIAMSILDFLAEATADMDNEQEELFVTGYLCGLAVGNEELYETIATLAAWERIISE